MKILIVTPARLGSTKGNWVTAERWANHLGSMGHEVEIAVSYQAQSSDLLIALHARRSAASVEKFRRDHPNSPLIVILTGTDLYRDLPDDPSAVRSIELADRLVVLNALGAQRLPAILRNKVRVIIQSVTVPRLPARPSIPGTTPLGFQVCVVGHLRPVKDPFLAVRALARLPTTSAIHILHVGIALNNEMKVQAENHVRNEPRYCWRGGVSGQEVFELLAGSKLHVLTSMMEGGANVLCEAIAVGVPTLSTRIDGSVGILGDDYPGLFPVGDANALANLLNKVETDPLFYDALRRHCISLQPLVSASQERAEIGGLIAELQ